MLTEVPMPPCEIPIPEWMVQFAEEAMRRGKKIDCFDYVPSSYRAIYDALQALPRGRFCEWGSGMGVATGIAALLGYDAVGVEIDERLTEASRAWWQEFLASGAVPSATDGTTRPQPSIRFINGDYFALRVPADVYFTYCWPSMISRTEDLFVATAPPGARLLICHGAEDIRCMVRSAELGTPGDSSSEKE